MIALKEFFVSPQERAIMPTAGESPASMGARTPAGNGSKPHDLDHRAPSQLSQSEIDNRQSSIFEAARPIIIKEILALHGGDLRSPMKYTRYLDGLAFADLCARRDQLLQERLPLQLDLEPKYGGPEA